MMIKMIERYFQFEDERGKLEGLINIGNWKELNLISSDKDMTRGNHYHKNTLELFIILSGRINVVCQKIVNGQLASEMTEKEVKTGDVFLIEPYINHIFYVLEDSQWINALSIPIEQNNPDIYRICPASTTS